MNQDETKKNNDYMLSVKCYNCDAIIENPTNSSSWWLICEGCALKTQQTIFANVLNHCHELYEVDKITEKIFLGNYETALFKKKLDELGIKNILVCGSDLKAYYPNEFKYLHYQIEDLDSQNIQQYLNEAIEFIDKSEKIYVHCRAGISRSPSFVIAYFMWKYKIPFYKAFLLVKEKRNIIYPNKGFTKQLMNFEKDLGISINENEKDFIKFKESAFYMLNFE